MANFKIASTLLCILLIGRGANAVINKSSGQSTNDEESTETKDTIEAEDRIISDVYGAPPQLSNDYGLPVSGGKFNGPATVYGPPEFTGHQGPVQVHPPPPPEFPPPRPHSSHAPPRKPKPHYDPPKTSYGPPLLNFGLKSNYGPPKHQYGPPSVLFGSPRPQHRPPLKFSAQPNQKFGPPAFGGHQSGGHNSPIPVSVENYGPPNREPSLPFETIPPKDFVPPPAPILRPQEHHGSQLAAHLYSPPPPPPPPGVPAPPTPPDIKYDGWQPIAGLVDAPSNHETLDNTYGPPRSNNGNFISHGSSSEAPISHASLSHSSSAASIESSNHNVPSNSYGEPIHNQEAQHLQTSVHQSTNSHGLPPPPLPQSEPLHNNQGPAKSIPGHKEQHDIHGSNDQNQFGNSNLFSTQFDHSIDSNYKTPNFDVSSGTDGLSLNELSHSDGNQLAAFSDSTSSSFAAASATSFNEKVKSLLSLHALPSETYGVPFNSNGHQHDTPVLHGGSDEPTLQQLPICEPADYSGSFSSSSFGGRGHGHGNQGSSLSSLISVDSYSAPPASSYSPNGRYPASQGSRGEIWHSASNNLAFSGFNKHHANGNHHQHHRNHGPPARFGPSSLTSVLIPPRARAPIKFRELIPLGPFMNTNRYLPPVSRPTINHGAPIKHQLPSRNGHHALKLSALNSFGKSFGSGNSFTKDSSLLLNSAIVAPHVQYGTPLSFNDFNTPAPILTYGAPNFGPINSFVSTTFGGSGAAGNLYKNMANNPLITTYGTPVHGSISSIHGASNFAGGHDCGFQSSQALVFDKFNNFAGDIGQPINTVGNAHNHALATASALGNHQNNNINHQNIDLFNNVRGINSGQSIHQHFKDFPMPSIHQLDLESHEQQQGELKDSYGNPVALSIENIDQSEAALTTNDVRANSIPSLPGYISHEDIGQHSYQHSDAHEAAFSNENSASAEALTATLNAQVNGQAKHYASNEFAHDTINHYTTIHEEGNEALAAALQAEGADGFQVQGSKGTYTLQIQSADGGLGTENSDGSIRHEQVLSNGLLQDILAAIEQPNDGPVRIHGSPQPQQLHQVYDDAITNAANQQQVNIRYQHQQDQPQQQDIDGSHNAIVQQILAVQGTDGASNDLEKSLDNDERIGLFYKNNGGYEESRKFDTRSVLKSERQAALESNEKFDENETNGSDKEADSKSS